jgi:uncharacterized protein
MEIFGHIEHAEGFEWDAGNRDKNWLSHKVTNTECEQVFFNQPLLVASDAKHSDLEARYFALGRTDADRELFLVFTLRKKLIGVVSARDMSRRERKSYREQWNQRRGE